MQGGWLGYRRGLNAWRYWRIKIIITKSTVPVTTGDEIEKIISKKISKKLFSVVSNPEFLREGEAIRDFTYPDRVVIGSNDLKSNKVLKNLYSPFETLLMFRFSLQHVKLL